MVTDLGTCGDPPDTTTSLINFRTHYLHFTISIIARGRSPADERSDIRICVSRQLGTPKTARRLTAHIYRLRGNRDETASNPRRITDLSSARESERNYIALTPYKMRERDASRVVNK